MDKINNINFTGISNIGFAQFRREPGAKHALSSSLSMVLRDDLKGSDLSEFKSVLKKITNSPNEYYFDKSKPNVLNLECYRDRNDSLVMLNGNVLEVENKTMPLFTYLAKLTRKILNMPEKDIVVNKDYVTYEAPKNLVYGGEIKFGNISDDEKFQKLISLFDKDSAKNGAKFVNDFVQNLMNRFFDV